MSTNNRKCAISFALHIRRSSNHQIQRNKFRCDCVDSKNVCASSLNYLICIILTFDNRTVCLWTETNWAWMLFFYIFAVFRISIQTFIECAIYSFYILARVANRKVFPYVWKSWLWNISTKFQPPFSMSPTTGWIIFELAYIMWKMWRRQKKSMT